MRFFIQCEKANFVSSYSQPNRCRGCMVLNVGLEFLRSFNLSSCQLSVDVTLTLLFCWSQASGPDLERAGKQSEGALKEEESPCCQPGLELMANTHRCVPSEPGYTFPVEVARRLAQRALERRPLLTLTWCRRGNLQRTRLSGSCGDGEALLRQTCQFGSRLADCVGMNVL